MEKYLTESNISNILSIIYPENNDWIHDKVFINRYRPDYRSDSLKLIIEFDGYLHYTSSKTIIRDLAKDELFSNNGYKVIRIPYFIQLSTDIIQLLFNKNINYQQQYPHGFISNDSTMIMPSDYCELGIKRFVNDINYFSCVKSDIISSLKNKIEQYKDIRYVLPESLYYLVD